MTSNLKAPHFAKWIFFILLTLSLFILVAIADPRTELANATCGINQLAPTNIIPSFVQQMEGLSKLVDKQGWGTFEYGSNPKLYSLFQCMNDLSHSECLLCFTEARTKLPRCIPSLSARVHLDGCFLRWDNYDFYQEATDNQLDTSRCNSVNMWTSDYLEIKKMITNVTDTAARGKGFAVSELQVYVLAQCWETLNRTGCKTCLEKAARQVNQCFPANEGRGMNAGCFLRYSNRKFFNDGNFFNDEKSNGGTKLGMKLGLGLGAGILCVILTLLAFVCYHKGCSSFTSTVSWTRNNKDQKLVEIFLKKHGTMAPKRYSYSDIKKITNSFKDKIGHGAFGEVYKGKLTMGGPVAVKLLNRAKGNGEDFINEVASISRTSHVNIVSLHGFCFDGSKRALVYEFMSNGSLEKFIYDHNTLETQSHLGWDVLYKIAVGVARGLEYLHRGCNTLILHLDIKPHNILLDQDFNPKISDFGLAKLYLRDESIASMLNGRGTPGYISPEMFYRNFGKVSHKSDVYSYGMMVLEMVGKRKNIDVAVDHTSEIYFPEWIYNRLELDEDLGMHGVVSEGDKEIAKKMILVALWCIQSNPIDRPEMSRVEEMLEGKLDLLSIPPKPYLCSPPRSPPAGLARHD